MFSLYSTLFDGSGYLLDDDGWKFLFGRTRYCGLSPFRLCFMPCSDFICIPVIHDKNLLNLYFAGACF